MKPTHTHTELVDGLININGEEKDTTIAIEGEVFEDNLFPMSAKGVHTRITVVNKSTGHVIGNQFINQKMNEEDLKAQCQLLAKDVNNTVKILTQ